MSKKRVVRLLNETSADYPRAWTSAETWRKDKGKNLPDWPDYCFFPMAGWYAAVCDELQTPTVPMPYAGDVARLAAFGAYRYTQSIYRVNEHLYESLIETVPKGALPVELLMRMPEWCVYIETPGLEYHSEKLFGFFAHLEYDVNTNKPELRLLLDTEKRLLPVPLHIGNWTITEAVDKAIGTAKRNAAKKDISASGLDSEFVTKHAAQLYPLISLLLYVCSDGVEYRAQARPANPQPKRTRRKGWRLFPAPHPRVWNLGDKAGATLEQAERQQKDNRSEQRTIRPHIRRAHWHTFYAGPRDAEEREVRVKWIPPLLVSGGDDD